MFNQKHFKTEGTVLIQYTGPAGHVVIPEGITVIGDSAFYGKQLITSVTMPDSVTEIQRDAFYGCRDLTIVRFSGNLVSIRANAFGACSNLKSVSIPLSVTQLDDLAFVDCHGLTKVTVSEELIHQSPRAFAGCKRLANQDGFAILHDVICDYFGPGGDVVIPEGISVIAPYAFMTPIPFHNGLTSVVIPASVKRIDNDAFRGAFKGDKPIPVALPEGICSIGHSAFRGAPLTTVRIPSTVTSMEKEAFSGCPLQTIRMNQTLFEQWNWEDAPNVTMGMAVQEGERWHFYGYSAKTASDNFTDYVHPGKWNAYDLELINNGPAYKYKAPARLLGCLGRLVDPVDLTDECRELHMEYLIKNAKKLIPLAEELCCPAIVEAMKAHGIINDKNKKAIAKLLTASVVPEIAAITL